MSQKDFNRLAILSAVALVALFWLAIPGVSEAAGEVVDTSGPKNFIVFNTFNVLFLIILGFLAGLISGFIGSGGAFVLTPGMMSIGAPAAIAVATNMCHKFPKAMVGAYKRFKYGQVDIKLGLILGVSATVGVQLGIEVQKWILSKWGAAGSNLYVSFVFVAILTVLGAFILKDALDTMRGKKSSSSTTSLAEKLQKINLPPVLNFKTANTRISVWITVPVGL
ncbi:MAG: sulfite exporter TauE/SafE family protein, partial [Eubacteriales bacterium]